MSNENSKYEALMPILKEIDAFVNLIDNWDGYGAIPLLSVVRDNAIIVLKYFTIPPSDYYPNPQGTISIKYDCDIHQLNLEIGTTQFTYYTTFNGVLQENGSYLDITEINLMCLKLLVPNLFL